jgi:molybdopterin molybdotransferase
LHILATVGFETVQVIAKPRIALIATGDELVPVSSIPEPHQIRRSNMAVIAGSLNKAGFAIQLNQHLPDDPQALRIGISRALEESEVLLISGAVSMGSKDDVPRVLESLGCVCVFHRIAQKPGKPMWFGKSPQGGIIFALPGNPVASLVCFRRYVLNHLCNWGTRDPVPVLTYPVGESLSPHPSMTHFLPALLEVDDAGKTILVPRRGGGSGNFASLLPSHGFIELPAGDSILPMGAQLSFFPWESI